MLKLETGQSSLELTQKVVVMLNELSPDWIRSGSINLKLVDDKAIRELNREYAGIDEPTDVLAFPYDEGEELGDIAISQDTAERQAQTAGTSLDEEMATLALHGILHIYGFDHATATQREVMDRIQREILAKAGVTYRDFNWKS